MNGDELVLQIPIILVKLDIGINIRHPDSPIIVTRCRS